MPNYYKIPKKFKTQIQKDLLSNIAFTKASEAYLKLYKKEPFHSVSMEAEKDFVEVNCLDAEFRGETQQKLDEIIQMLREHFLKNFNVEFVYEDNSSKAQDDCILFLYHSQLPAINFIAEKLNKKGILSEAEVASIVREYSPRIYPRKIIY